MQIEVEIVHSVSFAAATGIIAWTNKKVLRVAVPKALLSLSLSLTAGPLGTSLDQYKHCTVHDLDVLQKKKANRRFSIAESLPYDGCTMNLMALIESRRWL